tara:strand:- start:117 stop:686 length:570 start_codon:yes stop_codon:yes gene_type:complete
MSENSDEISRMFEIQRSNREQRHLYLEEWRLNVLTLSDEFKLQLELSAQYAQIALRATFFLNGGALVALPPLMQWLDAAQRQGIGFGALFFVAGLIAAALSAVCAYANFMFLAQQSLTRIASRAISVSNNYAIEWKDLAQDTEYQTHLKSEIWWNTPINISMYLALLLGLSSYGLFVFGVWEFRNLVAQ